MCGILLVLFSLSFIISSNGQVQAKRFQLV